MKLQTHNNSPRENKTKKEGRTARRRSEVPRNMCPAAMISPTCDLAGSAFLSRYGPLRPLYITRFDIFSYYILRGRNGEGRVAHAKLWSAYYRIRNTCLSKVTSIIRQNCILVWPSDSDIEREVSISNDDQAGHHKLQVANVLLRADLEGQPISSNQRPMAETNHTSTWAFERQTDFEPGELAKHKSGIGTASVASTMHFHSGAAPTRDPIPLTRPFADASGDRHGGGTLEQKLEIAIVLLEQKRFLGWNR
ncbi:hypothetical protein EVAR_20118_1 [Eumeta japonica]|uniref:Uncharacterized protein n=1 Tax=Eumeta variegata TaxID=151549 RepID=A0A4C1V323_EUMVA|nr:hypothetical protein EVAR_20118_1 [Eumeta japonica]